MKSYKYLILIILGIFLSMYFYFTSKAIEDTLVPATYNNLLTVPIEEIGIIKDEMEISNIIDLDFPNPLNKMYKAENGNNYVYTLSYPEAKINIKKGCKLKSVKYASDQLGLILRESYPNISLEEMGMNSIEEAYQATQLAIWEFADRTLEANTGSELSYIDSVKYDIGINKNTYNIIKKAKDLVSFVEQFCNNDDVNDEINVVTTLIVNTTKVKMEKFSDSYLIGPYTYKVENGNIKSAYIELEDIDGNFSQFLKIVDENNEEIEDYASANDIYVRIPNDYIYDKFSFKLKFKVYAKMIIGRIYTHNNQDYLIPATYEYPNAISQEVTINIDG